MRQYRYKVVCGISVSDLEELLRQRSEAGWEPYHIIHTGVSYTVIFRGE